MPRASQLSGRVRTCHISFETKLMKVFCFSGTEGPESGLSESPVTEGKNLGFGIQTDFTAPWLFHFGHEWLPL